MSRRSTAFTALALAALAAACEQPSPSDPQQDGPSFDRPPTASPFACVFTGNPSLSSAANSYFTTPANKKTAADIITAIQNAYDAIPRNTAVARSKGYELLTLVGQVARGPNRGPIAAGVELIKFDFNCMYETGGADAAGFEGWPDDSHYDFASALDAANGGAFYVRGGTGNPVADTISGNLAALNTQLDPAAGNVSALAPPTPPQANDSWSKILGQQVLFYGKPVPDGYDWKVSPRNAVFTPYVVLSLCQGVNGGGQEYEASDVVHQFGLGTLGFIPGSLCGDPPPLALLQAGGAFGLLSRLSRAATEFFSPEPLHASSMVLSGTTTGTRTAKGDEFTFLNLPNVTLVGTVSDLSAKKTIKVNSGRFSLTVNVTTPPPASEPAGGIRVVPSVVNNNGVSTQLFEITQAGLTAGYTGCDPASPYVVLPVRTTLGVVSNDGTPQPTTVTWTKNLCVTKSGTVTVLLNSALDGNNAAGVGNALATPRIGVVP